MANKFSGLADGTKSFGGINCYISYTRDDDVHSYVEKLVSALRASGISIVADSDDVLPGDRLIGALESRLQAANVLLFIGTPVALRSPWVQHELQFFMTRRDQRRDCIIIPITFSSFDLQIPPFLRDIQWLVERDLDRGPSRPVIEHLIATIRRFEGATRPVTPSVKSHPKEKRPLNEGKLIFVGRGEVGKTSLVKRLTNDGFRGDESKTQGINITRWALQSGTDILYLNIWDFGGQEIMHATHQFFLTERSIYLLVLNGREGGEDLDAEYWLKHITSFGGDSPVVIVQNKIAQHPFDLNYRGLQTRYPQIRGFIKTDCKENIGVEELRRVVSHLADTMPEIRMQFPAEWFSVKERIEAMDDNFVSYETFRHICSEEGVDVESERDTLSWALHCLGIALNYKDDPRLRETSVLKPEWVTQGIYKILNASSVAARKGEMELQELKGLLPAGQYPPEKYLFLLELMRKFSLCFAFPDQMDHYLIPELLGKEESQAVLQFRPKECLNFEYHYGILPEGVIPRFIVRSHILSRDQGRWRSGVVLAHEDCRALVTAQSSERRIIVRVAGGDAGGRRRLLAIIRYDIDRINAEFSDRLEVEAKVPLLNFPTFAVDYKKLLAFEKQGVDTFPEFVGDQVLTVKVGDLLNGVDFEAQRRATVDMLVNPRPVFFSYSHRDEALRDELETHLKLLQREGIISTWHDRKILPGDEWDREIDSHLERAKLILLLISSDFIASEYCWGKEVQRALERHSLGQAKVVPVMLRPCDWQKAPFAKLQGLPKAMKPVTTWRSRDAAWTDVAANVRRIAQEFVI